MMRWFFHRGTQASADAPPATPRRSFRMSPIGTVERPGAAEPAPDEFYDPAAETLLVIDKRWEDGLVGIEGFSHLVVLFAFDRAERRRVAGAPRPAEGRERGEPVGFFATRTPKRPNPIGMSCPRLLRRQGNCLVVTGIDAWPGTPILDLKGYSPRDELRPDATVPRWLLDLWRLHDTERGAD
jgi:tRNA-Thr(GGU) m(6)t(6)A37 methyltransferase TsaA